MCVYISAHNPAAARTHRQTHTHRHARARTHTRTHIRTHYYLAQPSSHGKRARNKHPSAAPTSLQPPVRAVFSSSPSSAPSSDIAVAPTSCGSTPTLPVTVTGENPQKVDDSKHGEYRRQQLCPADHVGDHFCVQRVHGEQVGAHSTRKCAPPARAAAVHGRAPAESLYDDSCPGIK
jgi:hypothetical protein